MTKNIPRSPFLNPRFSLAVKEFGIALAKTSSIKHRGSKGSAREDALRGFFKDRLPTKYAVTEGEVVDIYGQTSPQMDLVFYDQAVDFALNADSTSILPAEALLSTVEVKSTLNRAEIGKILIAARKLRKLKPFGKQLIGKNVAQASNGKARYFHCVFAYDTDLAHSDWMKREAERFLELSNGEYLVDVVYVVGRGILNIGNLIGRLEDDDGGAITEFYFSVLNFLQREAGRRAATPYDKYVRPAPKPWVKLI